jgi:hypothetical protein
MVSQGLQLGMLVLFELCAAAAAGVSSSSCYPLSHSINAIGPAPLRSGRKREHCSIVFAIITHIPSLDKILSNAPRYHPAAAAGVCAVH